MDPNLLINHKWPTKLNLKTLFTISYATLHNYQNTLTHNSEPKVNPTLINYDGMAYKCSMSSRFILTHKSVLVITQGCT